MDRGHEDVKKELVSNERSQRRRVLIEIALTLALTIVGGWLRFHALGRKSLWLDESTTFLQARLPLKELLQSVAMDSHPPLYHLLEHYALTLGDSEAALRFTSALCGTLSIPLLYLLGRAWFSRSVGLLAALHLTISPPHIFHSMEARMYALLTMEGILCWHLFGRLLERPRRSLWIGYGIAAATMLYTHYYGALFLLIQTGLMALLRYRGEVERPLWSRWLGVQVGLALLLLPWVAFAQPSIFSGRIHWIGEKARGPLWLVVKALSAFAGGGHAWLRQASVLAFFAAAFCRSETGRWRSPLAAVRERPVLLCMGYFAGPIAIMLAVSLVRPVLIPRYMHMTLPAFLLLVAVGLSRLFPGRLLVGGAALLMLIVIPLTIGELSQGRAQDYRELANVIVSNATSTDLVLFSPLYNEKPFDYYLRDREVIFRRCPQLSWDSSFEEVEGCVGDARRVWVVFTNQRSGDEKPDLVAALAIRFRPVQVYHVAGFRIALFERVI